jgi:tetratricopeptide (TPR) repeat protein
MNIPFGDPCFRACLFSIAISLADFCLIYLIFSKILPLAGFKSGPVLSVFAPLLFSFSYSIWEQSIIAKGGIYMLNIFFVLVLSWMLLEMYIDQKKAPKYFYLFCFTLGLSLTHHYMSQVVLIPAYIFLFFRSGAYKELKKSSYLMGALLFICGLSAYIYLPIRAGSAYLNWGDPSSLNNFLQVVTRWQYIRAEGTRSISGSFMQAVKFFNSTSYAYVYAGTLFMLIGMFVLYRKEKNLFVFLISIPAIFLLITALYLNLDRDKLYIMETYITPAYFPLSIFAACGLIASGSFAARFFKHAGEAVPIFALAAIIAAQIFFFYPKLDKSSYFYVYDYNKNLYDSLDYNSIAFIAGDGVVFPSWYMKFVKHYRPDVTIIGSAVLPMKWVRDNIKAQNNKVKVPDITNEKIGTESTGYIMNAIIRMNASVYPIYFSYNTPEDNSMLGGFTLMPKGVVFKTLPVKYAVPTPQYITVVRNLWSYYNLRGIFGGRSRTLDKRTYELYIKDYSVSLNSTGTFLEQAGLTELSLEFFKKAHNFDPLDHEYVYNIGNGYYNTGDIPDAVNMYKQCLSMKPDYISAWFNLAVCYYNTKDYDDALMAFKKVKEIDPARKDVDSYISFIENINRIGVKIPGK